MFQKKIIIIATMGCLALNMAACAGMGKDNSTTQKAPISEVVPQKENEEVNETAEPEIITEQSESPKTEMTPVPEADDFELTGIEVNVGQLFSVLIPDGWSKYSEGDNVIMIMKEQNEDVNMNPTVTIALVDHNSVEEAYQNVISLCENPDNKLYRGYSDETIQINGTTCTVIHTLETKIYSDHETDHERDLIFIPISQNQYFSVSIPTFDEEYGDFDIDAYDPEVLFMLESLSVNPEFAALLDSGKYGAADWKLDNNGVLTLSGTELPDIEHKSDAPWYPYHSHIKTVFFDEGIESIGNYLFEDYEELTAVYIPGSVIRIGKHTFENCTSLEYVELNHGLQIIDTGAFDHCESLESILIPDSVVEMGHSTFLGCYDLHEVTLSESLSEIPYKAFSSCKSLEDIDIPWNVSIIGGEAFSGCSDLINVTINGNINEIGVNAFYSCDSLKFINNIDPHAWAKQHGFDAFQIF